MVDDQFQEKYFGTRILETLLLKIQEFDSYISDF